MDFNFRTLLPVDAPAYYRLRAAGLKEVPILFLESLEEFEQRGPAGVAERIETNLADESGFLIGAFDESGIIFGAIGFGREKSPRLKHIGFIWGLYVLPEARGLGLGKKLISKLLEQAGLLDGLEQVKIQLAVGNESARKLYGSFGFITWGTEPRAVKIDETYYDDYHMILTTLPGRK